VDEVRRQEQDNMPLACGCIGFGQGSIMLLFGGIFWYGFWLIDQGAVDGGFGSDTACGVDFGAMIEKIQLPMISMLMLLLTIGQSAALVTDAGAAAKAAVELFERIDRPSLRDPFSESGQKLDEVSGAIEVYNVRFAYPTRPDFFICKGYSLKVEAGQTCALCGPSGSGKSTIVALLQRFYDPLSGVVMLDGVDIKSLNLQWLRSQIGLVGQEPVLFDGTVAQNIAYGKEGVTRASVETASKLANAHDFIMNSLSDGYDTQVGLGGGKLSGGQKQRVAIARALVRKPVVMLLDEATSALDNDSEKVVQAALDELMTQQKRTTITIAHRLSTIRNADQIAVVNKGKVVENGTHDDLLSQGGLYYELVQAQQ